jgi:hypothetical protein
MAIFRVTASKDNTISNAYEVNLVTRGTGSNMGASDILEVFMIYGQSTSASIELARCLIEFPLDEIIRKRNVTKEIPAAGSVSFFLNLYNAPHTEPVPSDFTLCVSPISQSWQEGKGLDMVEYSDLTYDKEGSNWINAHGDKGTFSKAIITVAGNPTNAQTMSLVDSEGTTTAITASTSVGNGLATDLSFGANGTDENVRNAILAAINNGSAKITAASLDTTKIIISQDNKGPLGDTTITNGLNNVTSVGSGSISTSNKFTGGGTWTSAGGDYLVADLIKATFPEGTEDMKLDVTNIVEDWITGSAGGQYNNYGFGIQLSSSHETDTKSFFTKKFFARNTEFYFKRPTIEAQWDDSLKDHRGSFYASSSLQPASDNLNTIYLYNRVRGVLTDYPIAPTSASFRTTAADTGTEIVKFAVTKPTNTTGTYKVEAHVNTTASTIYDVWFSGSTAYHTGTIDISNFAANVLDQESKYVLSLVNNDYKYQSKQKARFKLYTRLKNWSPNLYTVAQKTPENLIIEDAIYRIYRVSDGEEIIPYSSGSTKFTQLSYNVSGNYFDIDMSTFETGFEYGIQVSFYNDYLKSYKEQPYVFKFKVVE